MADYLDARPRNRSESVNTDASSTVASPLALLTPSTNPKLTPLIGTKFPTNTILKSHGRPPWYYLGYSSGYHHVLTMILCRYGEDGHFTSSAFVIAIAGAQAFSDPRPFKSHVSCRWVFQRKGLRDRSRASCPTGPYILHRPMSRASSCAPLAPFRLSLSCRRFSSNPAIARV